MKTALSVIGIMCGTSRDGLDLAYVNLLLEEENVTWELQQATTLPLPNEWTEQLSILPNVNVPTFLQFDRAFGRLLGETAKAWWTAAHLPTPDLIAAHGYTVWHNPKQQVSHQLGHGAMLAAHSGVPSIVDFRSSDIAYGGQGAPFAPFGDEALFPGYQAFLNLGGIANIYFPKPQLGYDLSGCNLLLNALSQEAGLAYDKDGALAKNGQVRDDLLIHLETWSFHQEPPPKSLHADTVLEALLPIVQSSKYTLADRLQTVAAWIGKVVGDAGKQYGYSAHDKLLVTGGGAHHPEVIKHIQSAWPGQTVVPQKEWIDFKEAILFAYLGALRWQGLTNTRKIITGAAKDTVGGAVYLPG